MAAVAHFAIETTSPLQPKACLALKPTKQSIFFSGRYINLHAIFRAQGIDMGLLSHIFNCHRSPTLNTAKKVSAALGMGLEAFLEALEIREAHIRWEQARLRVQHTERLAREHRQDMQLARAGYPVPPRLPGLSA